MPLALNILFLIVLFIVSGFFASAETAIFSLSKIERRRLEETHPHMARWVFHHLEHPRRTLLTILIANLFINTLASTIATLILIHLFGAKGIGFGMIAFTVAFIVFCEIMPKIFAVKKNELVSMVTSLPLQAFAILLAPVRHLMRFVTDRVLSLLIRERKEHTDLISEAELKALVKIGEEEGILDWEERQMIHKLFQLGERPVKSIMTPRIDLIALNIAEPPEVHFETMKKFHHSYFPVYQGSIDVILGILPVQEYMLAAKRDIRSLLQQPFFIPETKRIDDLLVEFRRKNERFAVCVDEYGGTAGVVTLEDILEEIFGEFYDEYAKVENPIREVGSKEYLVDGKISLLAFNEFFFSHLESKEAATLGGFILEKLGEVPEKGKMLHTFEFEFRIHDMIRQRIHHVMVKPKR